MGQQGRSGDRGRGQRGEVAALRIEDYALIGDRGTAALVGRDGSIDWLCLPRFDSGAVFAALIGETANGIWRLGPAGDVRSSTRRYRDDTLVLETTHACASGTTRVLDFMPAVRDPRPRLVRIVEGVDGNVDVAMQLRARFDYGDLPPWTRTIGDACTMTAVGDALALHASVPLTFEEHDPCASFTVGAGERQSFVLSWYPSHDDVPAAIDPAAALAATESWWRAWAAQIVPAPQYAALVKRSLMTLQALTYAPSGAAVAAVTTSLPEVIGGTKNWDYRYAWVRDSTFTISALLNGGLIDDARAWRDWVLCALAGRPENLQIMYSVTGERRIDEYELPRLAGYENSRPVRIGNAAYTQFQLGVYGETMGALALAHERGVEIDAPAWAMICVLLEHVETVWPEPDAGIWESRAEPRHYTHSKVLAWRAFDSAVKLIDAYGYAGPRDRWQAVADRIHADVCAHAFDTRRNAFAQSYGSDALDAAVLLLPIVGFLPPADPRVRGTVAALEAELMRDGFMYRTSADPETSAAHADPEGAFLACNFWLVENYVLLGRVDEARALFERLAGIANDVGLLAEEYAPKAGRQVGNVPQTLSHAALVNAAARLAAASGV
jgi:GH15 family glucan-1,4-alpha-glucosidase